MGAAPPADRPRRGLGGWIALWVAGEAVPAAGAAAAPSADERAALVALGLVVDGRRRDAGGRGRACCRGAALVVASPPAEAFDVSALNVAASLPAARGERCGTSAAARACWRWWRRAAAPACFGSDVDGELVGWARLNAGAQRPRCRVRRRRSLAPRGERAVRRRRLQRAALARAARRRRRRAPRYTSAAPSGEALALRFLDGVARAPRVASSCTRSSRPPSPPRSTSWRARAAVASVVFAHAPDGTPHALTEIRVARGAGAAARGGAAVAGLPAPVARHLRRAAPRRARSTTTPRRCRRRGWSCARASASTAAAAPLGTTFGGAADRRRRRGAARPPARRAARRARTRSSIARERLCVMIDRGHVILR